MYGQKQRIKNKMKIPLHKNPLYGNLQNLHKIQAQIKRQL